MPASRSSRIKILSEAQTDKVFGTPYFDDEDRILYFSLDESDREAFKKIRSNPLKVIFILQNGYFKAKQLFWPIDELTLQTKDIEYIIARYGLPKMSFNKVSVNAVGKQKKDILSHNGYKLCGKKERLELKRIAKNSASISTKPIFVFTSLLIHLSKKNIVVPAYSTLQDLVGYALNSLREELELKIENLVSKELASKLDKLLEKFESLYQLTAIKKDAKDFSLKQMEKEIIKLNSLSSIFKGSKAIIKKIGISAEGVKYYASMVDYYSQNRLKRLKKNTCYLYLLCFANQKYHHINDNLIKAFIYHTKKISDKAEELTKETLLSLKLEGHENLNGASEVLRLFCEKSIPDDELFLKVKQLAFSLLPQDKFPFMCKFIKDAAFDKDEVTWEHKESLIFQYKRNLRPLINAIDLQSSKSRDPLISSINSLKKSIISKKPLKKSQRYYHTSLIPPKMQKHLFQNNNKQLNTERWEIFLYDQISKSLKTDGIYCKNSTIFKSFDDDLIDIDYWRKNKKSILAKIGSDNLLRPINETLEILKKDLEFKISTTNKNISSGLNSNIKVKKNKGEVSWNLLYQQTQNLDENKVFSNIKQVSISQVLRTVASECNLFESFSHILEEDVRSKQSPEVILAVILAMATNTGLGKMAEISDLSFHELSYTMQNCFRLDTVGKANDSIVNEIVKMPLFRLYDIEEGVIFSSSDGQKFESQVATINSRHSSKYFGMNKGVSSIPGIANNVPFNAVLTSANEHESNYVFDIVYNNSTDIDLDIHTTDTHGSNKANYILLHLFGFKFAPRLKNIKSRTKGLVGFKNSNSYKGMLIPPSRKANTKLISDQWDDCLRIFASLAVKKSNQSTLVRKLCAGDAKNKTKLAIWELNEIIKSTYIYEFIDDLQLRQNVQKTLNRGESFNKLTRAIATVGSSKLRFRTEMEQKISLECNRLIANIVIFYNLKLLSHMKKEKISIDAKTYKRIISRTSPVAWKHINLQGKYEFRGVQSINFNEIVGT